MAEPAVSLQQCCQDKGAKETFPLDFEEVEKCTWVLINLNNKLRILVFILILVYIRYPGYHHNQTRVKGSGDRRVETQKHRV